MIPRPDQATEKQLRGFAVLLPLALLLVAWMVQRHAGLSPGAWPTWALGVAGALVLWAGVGVLLPRAIRPLYLLLGWATWPIGMVISTVLVALLFYLVVTPIGLLLRLSGRDPLALRRDPERTSLWIERRPQTGRRRYTRMY
jgi:hypothetical protein